MKHFTDSTSIEKKMLFNAAKQNIPINGSLELLPLCNMNCDMCYVRLTKEEQESLGHIRNGEEWIFLGKELIAAGTLFLLLTGGEPLLHPNFKEIYLSLKKEGVILTINTNGTLINESWAEFFGRHKPRRINITLYGADNTSYEKMCHHPGGFDKVITAINLLKSHNVDVKLNCSVTPANINDISRMYTLAKELGVPLITDSYMMPSVRERTKPFNVQSRLSPEEAAFTRFQVLRLENDEKDFLIYCEELLRQIDSFEVNPTISNTNSCMAGHCSFSINWQGNLQPCVITSKPSVSVFEVGFMNAWRQVSNAFTSIQYCPDCSVCPRKILCSPCPVASKLETGDYMGRPDYLCRYAAETERLLRKFFNESNI